MPVSIDLPHRQKKDKTPAKPKDRIINSITFFGDSAISEESPIYKSVWETARLLANKGYRIVDGGGPGIMKAATDGAESVNGDTVAVYWQPKLASFFEGKNLANVTDQSKTCSNYMVRTLGLIEYGDAYVVCKGGTGTISEFGMVWALAKLYYGCHKPVILYGKFWDKIITCIQNNMNIDELELGVLYQATTSEDILKILNEHEAKIKHCIRDDYIGDEKAFIVGADNRKVGEAYDLEARKYHEEHAGKLEAQDQLDEFISMVNPPAQVLDIGTGAGFDSKYLGEKYSVTGIEISKIFYDIAKYENPGMNIILADFVQYDLSKNKFKGVWARNSLHHMKSEDLDHVFQKISDSLVQGGIFYTIVRKGTGEKYIEEEKHYQRITKFYHFFSEEELIQRAKKAGLSIVKIDHTQRSHKWLVGVFRKD